MTTDTTVTINNADETPKKLRKITVYKREVFEDIEMFTYKHVESSDMQGAEKRNAVSADTTEGLDGKIIIRLVEFRDAQLRKLIPFALAKKTDFGADDVMTLQDDRYHYWLKLPEEFDDNLLESVAEYFHRFLVWGALYDWYGMMGNAQANFFKNDLDKLEDEIRDTLRKPSLAKRPMQPFGPAKRNPLR